MLSKQPCDAATKYGSGFQTGQFFLNSFECLEATKWWSEKLRLWVSLHSTSGTKGLAMAWWVLVTLRGMGSGEVAIGVEARIG